MLCHFANSFPRFVASFLQRGRTLKRRFREEIITDLMMGSLLSLGGGRVLVEFPNESVTGADMEWNFINEDHNTSFRILLQAKQLYGNGKIWKRHCYRELFHQSGAGGELQAKLLCETARTSPTATYPLYIFYHPAKTCDLSRLSGIDVVQGVNLADGFFIEALVKSANTPALRTTNRSLGTILPSLFPLAKIFCPTLVDELGPVAFRGMPSSIPLLLSFATGRGVIGFPLPPTPEEVRQRLVDKRFGVASYLDELSPFPSRFPDIPRVADVIPADVAAILNRRSGSTDGQEVQLDRWRVTFVSRNPRVREERSRIG
jgi:hypothetical protein